MRVTDRVLVRPERDARGRVRPSRQRKLHDVNCTWAAGGNTGDYEERPRSDFTPDHPVCSRCGGPGGVEG